MLIIPLGMFYSGNATICSGKFFEENPSMTKKYTAPLLAPYGSLQNLALAAKVGGGKGGGLQKGEQEPSPKVQRRKTA